MCTPKVIHKVIHLGARVAVKFCHLIESLEVIADLEIVVWLGDCNYGADGFLNDSLPYLLIYFLFYSLLVGLLDTVGALSDDYPGGGS